MAGRGGQRKNVLLPPINYVFKLMQNKTPVRVWLFEDTSFKIEGNVMGFDEFMNITLENAVLVKLATKEKEEVKRPLGSILLKGDNVALIQHQDP